jgi:hypothetical protein
MSSQTPPTGYQSPAYQRAVPPELITLLDSLKREIKRDLNCVRIGIIQQFYEAEQRADIKIAQQQVATVAPDGTRTIIEYPVLLSVPVCFPSGGGYTLTFPIAAGDECLVLFNDRDIDTWVLQGAGQPPATPRLHDLSDGLAIVGVRSNPRVLSNVSTTSTQLRSDAGDVHVDVSADTITLLAPEKVVIDSPLLQINGIVTVLNEDSESIPCNINGDIITNGDVVASDVSLVHHTHPGVQSGSSDTGEPNS